MSTFLPRTTLRLAALLLSSSFLYAASPVKIERFASVGEGIVKFLREGYDASKTPALAEVAEPVEQGKLPADWRVTPVFTQEKQDLNGYAYFDGEPSEFNTAQIDAPPGTSFYGTGEVTGHLLRKKTSIGLWNSDAYLWERDAGSRLYQSHPWCSGQGSKAAARQLARGQFRR